MPTNCLMNGRSIDITAQYPGAGANDQIMIMSKQLIRNAISSSGNDFVILMKALASKMAMAIVFFTVNLGMLSQHITRKERG
jgi:hypothetical protein